MNAGRKYLGVGSLLGKVFVTSGLGGMSGAQAKASVIAGCVGVIAEVRRPGRGPWLRGGGWIRGRIEVKRERVKVKREKWETWIRE